MPDDDSAKKNPLGPVGGYVMANLKDLREARGLTYRQLSDRLGQLGRPIPTLGLSRIEAGSRRVDADDLVALALALAVNPSALLLPRDVGPDDAVMLAEKVQEAAKDAWNWADGRAQLPAAGPFTRSTLDVHLAADFAQHSRPSWAPLPVHLQVLADQEAARES